LGFGLKKTALPIGPIGRKPEAASSKAQAGHAGKAAGYRLQGQPAHCRDAPCGATAGVAADTKTVGRLGDVPPARLDIGW